MSTYVKSVLAFLSLVVTNLVANYVNSGTPTPQTAGEWLTAVLTTAAGTFAVYQWPNKPAEQPASE
jgi:hypothetical protein